jgi:tRNA threonylcarbamoyladenosine biosynthesis protein TsaB
MANILCIETATKWCSVAIASGDTCKVLIEDSADQYIHSEKLHVFIEQALNQFEGKIEAVAVSKGPGSYTGLRIGVAAAKGLCMAWNVPLIGISSLQVIAAGMQKKNPNLSYFPVIDARRMEVFGAKYDRNLELIDEVKSHIFDEDFSVDLVGFVAGGDGAEKGKDWIEKSGGTVDLEVYNSAANMINLANTCYEKSMFEDLILFEPDYHKNFKAGKPKKLI